MAKARCVLCEKELGLFDKNGFIFYGSTQNACPDCVHQYEQAQGEDLAALDQRILSSPHFKDRDSVLKNIARLKSQVQEQSALKKARIKHCPHCDNLMVLKLNNFTIGSHGDALLGDRYEVDLYACPKCGKVELFTAGFIPPDEDYSTVSCPICGTQHNWRDNCPNCAEKEFSQPVRLERGSSGKPPCEK